MRTYRVIVPRVGMVSVTGWSRVQVARFIRERYGASASVGIQRVTVPA